MMTYPLAMAFEYLPQTHLDKLARDLDGDGIVQSEFEIVMLRRLSRLSPLTLSDLGARDERKGREPFREELASRKTIVVNFRNQPRSTAPRRLRRVVTGAASATRIEVFLGSGMHENEAFGALNFEYVFPAVVKEIVVHAEGDDRPTVTTVRSRDLIIRRDLRQADVDPPTALNATMTYARLGHARVGYAQEGPILWPHPGARVLLYCRFRTNESIHDEGDARMGENEGDIRGEFGYLIMDAISYYGNCEDETERMLARFALGNEYVTIDVEGVDIDWDAEDVDPPRQIVQRWTDYMD